MLSVEKEHIMTWQIKDMRVPELVSLGICWGLSTNMYKLHGLPNPPNDVVAWLFPIEVGLQRFRSRKEGQIFPSSPLDYIHCYAR